MHLATLLAFDVSSIDSLCCGVLFVVFHLYVFKLNQSCMICMKMLHETSTNVAVGIFLSKYIDLFCLSVSMLQK